MNRLQLQALAGRAVRRRVARIRPAYSPRQRRRGLMGLGSVDNDLQRAKDLASAAQAFQSELLHAVDGMPKSEVRDNATAYASVADKVRWKASHPDIASGIMAGGKAAKDMLSLIKGGEQTLAETKKMWDADLNDPSGAASMEVAKQIDLVSRAQQTSAGEKNAFWIKATDVKNPFSPLSIFSTIKRYAIWGLVIGGVVLAAPVMFPAIGKLIGHARTKPSPAPSTPQTVTANPASRRALRRVYRRRR